MPRPPAMEDDALAQAVLMDVLRDGPAYAEAARAAAGPVRVRDSELAPLLSDGRWADMDGLELSRRVVALQEARSSERHATSRPAAKPAPGASAPAAPRVPAPSGAGGQPWEGADFLGRVDGPIERFPPLRVLFLAHRVEASGQLDITSGAVRAAILMRAGRVVHVEGVPDLFAGLPVALPDRVDLIRGVGLLVAEGLAVDDVMRAASEALGAFVAGLAGHTGGNVRWTPRTSFPAGAFPLPVPVPRMIAAGLRARRPMDAVRRDWSEREGSRVILQLPMDSSDDKLGLDMTALRLLRLAPRNPEVVALVSAVAGTGVDRRTDDVLRTLDLLEHLGLVRVGVVPVVHAPRRPERPAAKEPPPAADPRAAELREELARLSTQHPVEVLGLAEERVITVPAVESAFRRRSAEVHPDRFRDASVATRDAVLAILSAFQAAREALLRPGGIEDAQKFVDARARGLPYVSEAMEREARMAFKKGEVLLRGREYRLADPHFETAARLDPLTWPHVLYAARTGYLVRRLTAAEALARIDGISGRKAAEEAERLTIKGEILKLEGEVDAAVQAWRKALETNPSCHAATRELRLIERRSQEAASGAGRKSFGGIFGAFGRK